MSDTVKQPGTKLSAGKGAGWWVTEITKSRKSWKTYRDRAQKVIERYRDERDSVSDSETRSKKFAMLYSNTETLGPAIYSQVPVPDIRRRWQTKDPVGRTAALVLQRAAQYCVESYDFDGVLDACKLDYLLPGFAVARVDYRPYLKSEPKKDEAGKPVMDGDKPVMDERLVYEEVGTKYVGWDRFVMSRSKIYERVWYVAFGDDLTKDEVEAQFGADIAGKITYGRKEEQAETSDKEEAEPVARVWEVWCKRGRGRFVVAEGYDGWLKDPEADPLRLEGFFPNAKPVWSISTNDTLKPVPEYLEYQDQALELDDLTDRIDVLTSALRRRGVYDQTFATLGSMLSATSDNQFVGIESWAAFMDKGGLEKLAFEMPLDGLVTAIVALDERREKVKQIIYEVTGIADIVRGSSNPNETLGAQQLKGKWAGLRISSRQKKFGIFARDLVRLKAEIIAERFKPETLAAMTGVELPYQADKLRYDQMQAMAQQQAQATGQQPAPVNPEEAKFYAQPTWEEVIQVLRDDKLRGFKIDIETDSTVQPDADAEKAARTELLTAIADFCQRTGLPCPPQLAGQLITFTTRAFKVGSQMEQELEVLEQSQGPSPQQQQKEQELQQREQAVMQAEAKANDDMHRAQIAGKDAKAAADAVAHKQEIYDLTKRFDEQVQRIEEVYATQMQKLVAKAEEAVGGIVRDLDNPDQGAPIQ